MGYLWDFQDKNGYANRSGNYKTKVQLQFILNNLPTKMDSVFDIAGGAGRFAIPLLQYTKDITVLDINETAIQLLNERNKEIKTICGGFIESDISRTFSLVLCIEALGYFKDWDAYFKKINSLMTKDSRFIFTHTNSSSWRFLMRRIKRVFDKKTKSYTEMNMADFRELLKRNGLEIEKMEGMNWMPLPMMANGILVDIFAFLEKKLRLNKWHSQSPWLLISVRKTHS